MTLLESIDLFPMILTLLAFQIGRMAQEKWKKPIFNPTLIGMILVVAVLLATGMNPAGYTAGMVRLSWLMTRQPFAWRSPCMSSSGCCAGI